MQYNTPNYRLIGSYIDHKVSAQQTPEEARFDKEIAQQLHFNRNNLQGQRNELYSTISGIMSQLDYDMPSAEKYVPPSRLSTERSVGRSTERSAGRSTERSAERSTVKYNDEPQDMLNDKVYRVLNRDGSAVPSDGESVNGSANNAYPNGGQNSDYPAPHRPFKPTAKPYVNPYNPYDPRNKHVINPYIRPPFHERLYREWSLMRTTVLVIVLLAIFYLLLNMIVQRRRYYKAQPDEGNMNPPGVRLAEAPLVGDTD